MCIRDRVYPLLTGLVEALHSPEPVVPWEYREIYAKKGERWLHNAASFIFSVPGEPSPTTDCWLARAASLLSLIHISTGVCVVNMTWFLTFSMSP